MRRLGKPGSNLVWQEHLDEVAVEAAFDQANRATANKATHMRTSRGAANADSFGEPGVREAETMLAFEPGVTKKMRVSGTVDDAQPQHWHDKVIDLFPHECRVRHFYFHDVSPVKRDSGGGAEGFGAGEIREIRGDAVAGRGASAVRLKMKKARSAVALSPEDRIAHF